MTNPCQVKFKKLLDRYIYIYIEMFPSMYTHVFFKKNMYKCLERNESTNKIKYNTFTKYLWDTDQASGFASYDGLGMVHLLCQNANAFGFSFIDFEFGFKVVFLCWLCFFMLQRDTCVTSIYLNDPVVRLPLRSDGGSFIEWLVQHCQAQVRLSQTAVETTQKETHNDQTSWFIL